MSLSVQAKLLRALEQGEFERVGGSETIKVDVRVIAATNKDLQRLVESGDFREDLFFRLNVVPLVAPPLRKRKDDVPLLANHFINQYAEENDFLPKTISEEAMKILCAYDWPGNIRELKNLVERLSIMVTGDEIASGDLPDMAGPQIARPQDGMVIPGLQSGKSLREVRESVEQGYISEALQSYDWNVTRAAKFLGIERTNLHKKINYYQIER